MVPWLRGPRQQRERGAGTHGFTLLELIIVMVVLALLVALAWPALRRPMIRGVTQQAARQFVRDLRRPVAPPSKAAGPWPCAMKWEGDTTCSNPPNRRGRTAGGGVCRPQPDGIRLAERHRPAGHAVRIRTGRGGGFRGSRRPTGTRPVSRRLRRRQDAARAMGGDGGSGTAN